MACITNYSVPVKASSTLTFLILLISLGEFPHHLNLWCKQIFQGPSPFHLLYKKVALIKVITETITEVLHISCLQNNSCQKRKANNIVWALLTNDDTKTLKTLLFHISTVRVVDPFSVWIKHFKIADEYSCTCCMSSECSFYILGKTGRWDTNNVTC